MTYLDRNSRSKERIRRIVYGVSSIVFVTTAIIFFAPHFFPAVFTTFARPFWRAEFSIQSGSLKTPEQLLLQNEELKRQLEDASVRLATIQAIESENAELKTLMGRASTTPYILAAVLVRPPISAYDDLIIDAGRDHGFSTTSLVYTSGNIPIGKVSDVFDQTSKVILFSSIGQKFDVMIGPSHAPAVAIGRGGGQFQAEIPRGSHIVQGDTVTVSSLNGKPFGTVTSLISDPAQIFETVLFAPPVNIFNLRWVLVQK